MPIESKRADQTFYKYPHLAWSSVLDKHKSYAANTRLYAVNFIRSILTIREQRVARLKDQSLHHNIVDQSLSSSLRSGDSQDFDMFDDFDYEALNMDIEKVYYDDTDRMLAQVRRKYTAVLGKECNNPCRTDINFN